MTEYFVLKKEKLEKKVKENFQLENVMEYNILKLKGNVFLGLTRSFLLESYYKLFYDYNENRENKEN